MKIGEAEQWLRQQLATLYGEGEAGTMAAWVLEKVTGLDRSNRLAKRNEPLVVAQLHRLTEISQHLQQHQPVQYLLEEAHFYGLNLFVNNAVLIPRSETEELVHWIITDMKAMGKPVFERRHNEADLTTELKIMDVGTGSGCIALALKKEMPRAEVWGCDASDEALTVARRNASALDIRVDFNGLNFLDDTQWSQLPTVDIIVSNPPYIPIAEKDGLSPNVVQYEPHTALFVPDDDALIFYKALARFGKKRLYPTGAIYAEIHEDSGAEVKSLFEKEGYTVALKKDMQGKDRMVKAVPVT